MCIRDRPGSVFSPYTSITTNLLFFDNTKPTTETWFYRVDIPSDRKHFSKTKPMELKHFDDCIAWWNDRKEIPDGENFKAKKFTAEYLPVSYTHLRSADFLKFDMGKVYMMVAIAILPVIIVYLLLSKFIVRGVALGGVKG